MSNLQSVSFKLPLVANLNLKLETLNSKLKTRN